MWMHSDDSPPRISPMERENIELTTTSNSSKSEDGSDFAVYPDDSISACNVLITTVERAISEISGGPSLMSTRSSGLSFATNNALFKMIGGRAYNSQSDLYLLPADDDEHSRLDMQHFAVSIHMDSLYPFARFVRQAIQMEQVPTPAVLDVGTGSGRWAIDMAVNYPWVRVIGMDFVPPALLHREDIPENCRFEIDDANLSMEHHSGAFNLVHARSIDTGLNDHESFIYEIARTLRPGGVLILGTGNPFIDEDHQPVPFVQPGELKFSWVQYTFYHVYMALINRGSYGANARRYWRYWVQNNPNYKEHHHEDHDIPIGPWKEGMTEKEIFASNLMREDIARVIPAYKHLLLIDGHEEADVDHWIQEATRELRELTQRAYCRWSFVGAVRGDNSWQPREVPLEPADLWDKFMTVNMNEMNPILKSA